MLAFHLFNNCQFESAMNLFQKLQMSPILIVALYPTLLTTEIQASLEYPIAIVSPSNSALLITRLCQFVLSLVSADLFLDRMESKTHEIRISSRRKY